MNTVSHGVLRDFLAMVIIIVACPLALAGGTTIGCVGQAFNPSCALGTMFVSQIGLLLAGLAAGFSTRGWTGLLLVYIGVFLGMMGILVLTIVVGRPLAVDPISGVIATVWFSAPVTAGYGVARLVSRVYSRKGGGDGSG
jgi:hypothetical protein